MWVWDPCAPSGNTAECKPKKVTTHGYVKQTSNTQSRCCASGTSTHAQLYHWRDARVGRPTHPGGVSAGVGFHAPGGNSTNSTTHGYIKQTFHTHGCCCASGAHACTATTGEGRRKSCWAAQTPRRDKCRGAKVGFYAPGGNSTL